MKITQINDILIKAHNKGLYNGKIVIEISRGQIFDVEYLIRDWLEDQKNVDGIKKR